MHTAEEPIVERCTSSERKGGDFVKITFKPDLEKFNMTELDDSTCRLISKRAYDVSSCVCMVLP